MDSGSSQHTTKPTLVELQARIRGWKRRTDTIATEIFSTGCGALDALFPSQGIRPGSLVEWIGEGPASGVGTLSLLVGRNLAGSNRPLILIDPQRQIYPVALSALGFDLLSMTMIRPSTDRETLWSCEEALRCAAVGTRNGQNHTKNG
jgi:protein ImuA